MTLEYQITIVEALQDWPQEPCQTVEPIQLFKSVF